MTIRKDLNDLVRDEKGMLSPVKIGLLVGQWLSVKLILEHGSEIIANWDSLIVLFSVLVAPDVLKLIVRMKYSQPQEPKFKDVYSDTRTQNVTRTQSKDRQFSDG